MATLHDERLTAISLLRAGSSTQEIARQIGHSERWVRKWQQRFAQEGWSGLLERSRAPKQHGRRIAAAAERAIVQARTELEAKAALGRGLKYVGGRAVRTELKAQGCQPLPSVATIERRLRAAGLTHRRAERTVAEVQYPHLRAGQPHQLCQVDIAPHMLTGGQPVACFNALDVVSRYATGQAYARAGAQEALQFAVHVWQTIGVAHYTQVDNQDCFCGGHTHPYVLGRLVRLALAVGTELLFSPIRHPESNGYVERFHQEYDRHVWQDTYRADLSAVQRAGASFFDHYRHSPHHKALHEQTPDALHEAIAPLRLPADFTPPAERAPLYEGRVHFIRRIRPDGTISVLNVAWTVPNADPLQGVWATLELTTQGVSLTVYDAAPDAPARTCLACYPFPLTEEVLPRQPHNAAAQTGSASPAPIASPARPLPASRTTAGLRLVGDLCLMVLGYLSTRHSHMPRNDVLMVSNC